MVSEELQVGEGKVGLAQERVFGSVGLGKLASDGANPLCPNCGPKTEKVFLDGLRVLKDGRSVQRYLCMGCGFRFSVRTEVRKLLNTSSAEASNRQICALGAKNLTVPKRKRVGAGVLSEETRASITVFEGWLQKEGYAESNYPENLKTLVYLGADLMNPEDVKVKLGAHPIKDGAKLQYVYSYEAYMRMIGLSWERPYYKQEEIIPFIPEEGELDQLIAAAHSRRMGAYLQSLKETFADPGEGLKIERRDVSGNFITINHPVKGHRPRTLEVSNKLIAMLSSLPHKSERFFDTTYNVMVGSYVRLRRRVAEATKNERIDWIELRTFRHWGGTHIAEITNGNVLIVMKLLGHKRVENSMKYINIWQLKFRNDTNYDVASATTIEEAKANLAAGFTYVQTVQGIMLYTRVKRISLAGTPISKRENDLVNLYEKVSGDVSRASPPSSFSVLFCCCLFAYVNLVGLETS